MFNPYTAWQQARQKAREAVEAENGGDHAAASRLHFEAAELWARISHFFAAVALICAVIKIALALFAY